MAATRDAVERFGDRMAALALVRPKKPEALPVRITRTHDHDMEGVVEAR